AAVRVPRIQRPLLRTASAWCLLAAAALWAQDPAGLATRELHERAQDCIARASYAAAVPWLVELDRRLAESVQPAARQTREGVRYYLGLGRLAAGEFAAAEVVLGVFAREYPDSVWAAAAKKYRGDAAFYRGDWAAARERYAQLRRHRDVGRLDGEARVSYWEHYADCTYALEDWSAAAEVFGGLETAANALFDSGRAAELRAKAASYRLQAAMAQADFATAAGLLSALSAAVPTVRHDVALNLALLRGGDSLYAEGRAGEALRFYELVLRAEALRIFWHEQLARTAAEMDRIADVPA